LKEFYQNGAIFFNNVTLLIAVESFGYMKRLDKLDLGENFITSIPPGIFNKTLSVNDLNLVSI
jgi:hypothetical protein